MKGLIVFISFLFSFPSFSQDQVSKCELLSDGNSYILSTDKGFLQRRQTETGKLLVNFEQDSNAISYEINELKNELISISRNRFQFYNLSTGNILRTITLPEVTNNAIGYYYESHKPTDLFNNQLVLVSKRVIYTISLETGEIVSSKTIDFRLSQYFLLSNGEILLLDKENEKLLSYNTNSSKIATICKIRYRDQLTVNENRTHFSIGGAGKIKWYSIKENTINLEKELFYSNDDGGFLSEENNTVYLKQPKGIFEKHWGGLRFFFNDKGDFTDFKLDNSLDGFDAKNGKIVYWENDQVSTTNLNGFTLSSIHIDEISDTVVSKDIQRLFCDSSYVSHNSYNGVDAYGTLKGDLIFNGKHPVLGSAITAIKIIDKESAYVGGTGRVVVYNIKQASYGQVFRGIDGNTRYIEAADETVAVATKYSLYVFRKNGELIKHKLFYSPIKGIEINKQSIKVSFSKENKVVRFGDELSEILNPKQKILITNHHNGVTTSAQYSKNGRRILSCDLNGNIKIWDTRNLVSTVETFMDDVTDVLFVGKNDEEVFAFGSTRLFLLDARNLEIKREFKIPSSYKYKTQFNIAQKMSETQIILSDIQPNLLWVLNLNSGYLFNGKFNTGNIFGMACDTMNRFLYTQGIGGITKINLRNFKVVEKIKNENELNNNMYVKQKVYLSPDKTKIIIEGKEGASVFNLLNGEQIQFFPKTYYARFLSNDEVVVYNNIDKRDANFSVTLHKLKDPKYKKVIWRSKDKFTGKQIRDHVESISVNKFQKTLLLSYSNGQMETVDLKTFKPLRFSEFTIVNRNIKFNPINGNIAVAHSNKMICYDWQNLKESRRIPFNYSMKNIKAKFEYSSSGKYLLKKYGKMIQVCDNSGENIISTIRHEGFDIELNSEETMLVSYSSSLVQVFNLITGKLLFENKMNEEEAKKSFYSTFYFIDNFQIASLMRMFKKDSEKMEFHEDRADEYVITFNFKTKKEKRSKKLNIESFSNELAVKEIIYFESAFSEVSKYNTSTGLIDKIKGLENIDDLFWNGLDNKLILTTTNGEIIQLDFVKETLDTLPLNIGRIDDIDFYKTKMLVRSVTGDCMIVDNLEKKRIIEFGFISNEGFVFYDEQLNYSGEKVNSIINFSKGDQVFPFSQFDLKYNRPDIILDRLGYASDEKIESYRHAYQKRLQKMGFTEDMLKGDFHLPELGITNKENLSFQTASDITTLNITTSDSKYPLDRINVWINNVPIYGVNGISLRSKMTQDFDSTIQLQLNEGDNKIEVSVLNQAGAESYKETVYMTCTKPAPKPNLYFVGIGVKNYADQNMNLKFSDKDIRDIADMYGKNKSYGKIYIDTFLNASVTKDVLPQIRKRLESSTIHDQVIFMYSGHGILDDSLDYFLTTHDIDFFNPKEKGIPYEAIDELMDNIPARKKLVLIDACNSGEVDKDELEIENTGSENSGVTVEITGPKGDLFKKYTNKTNSFEMMQELFTDLRRGTGATVISSSSGKLLSFEDKKYQNGIYTYALKLGLEGAADKDDDGEISVTELKEYLYTKVEELTNGKQKPTARQENLEYDFRVW